MTAISQSQLKSLQVQLDTQRRKVDVDHFDLTLRELVRMASVGELVRAPVYQRKFRWSDRDESRLIESLFLGLPVPSIFVATNDDGTWEVVDGLQRVSTIMHFLADTPEVLELIGKAEPLQLGGLEKLTTLNKLTFSQLPSSIAISFPRRSLRVTALSDKSDPGVRFDMFERLNRGGVALTPQEVRACIFRGAFNDKLRDLASYASFVDSLKLQAIHKDDGTGEELVLKYFAYLNNRQNFGGAVTAFLNEYMKKRASAPPSIAEIELFKKTADHLKAALKGHPFLRENVHVTPQNQFEACMVGIAEILKKNKPVNTPPGKWQNDRELVQFSTKGTNTPSALRGRIDRAIKLFSK